MEVEPKNLLTLPDDQIYLAANSFFEEKNFDQIWDCIVILGNRGINNNESFFKFINLILRYTNLLLKSKNYIFNEKISICRNWLFKAQSIYNQLNEPSVETVEFLLTLAECCNLVGPRAVAIKIYLDVANFGGRSSDFYRLAELLLLEAKPQSEICKVLQIGIQKDPGKYWIREELEVKILNKHFSSIAELKEITSSGFEFSNSWFTGVIPTWNVLLSTITPQKILEIGSYEGASTTYLIESLANCQAGLEIHCVDTWQGGEEHKKREIDFENIEQRFDSNIRLASKNKTNLKVIKHKGRSDAVLAKFLSAGKQNYFDFIYIDGSHEAPDVLCDAVLAFRLLKIGGVLGFDDYLFMDGAPHERNIFNCPKFAIDSFVNTYFRKIRFMPNVGDIHQVYLEKYSD